jgi:hypothetical protein
MTHIKKLIEVALPLEAINTESAREKSIRRGRKECILLKHPFRERPDFAATSVNYDIAELLDGAEVALKRDIKET